MRHEVIPFDFPADPPLPCGVQRLLVVGGSFNPPHRAHDALPAEVSTRLGADWTVFVPARQSPLRDDDSIVSGEHRLAMLRLALAGRSSVSISRFEIDRPVPSFTVHTLRAIRRALGPTTEIRFVIGSDQALQFARWRDPEAILSIATPAVLVRPPDSAKSLRDRGLPSRWSRWIVETQVDPISATEVRRRIAAGESTEDAVHPDVVRYIHDHGLYGAASRS